VNTYSGLTTVDEGALIVNGEIAGGAIVKSGGVLKGTGFVGNVSVEAGGMFAPGNSPGTINVEDLTFNNGSTLEFELGVTRDHIMVTNNSDILLGGLLKLTVLPGFNPAAGETFPLFEGAIGSIAGSFATISAPTFNGNTLNVLYNANQVLLQVAQATPLTGDYNGNGKVDAADYVVWRKTNGTQTGFEAWRSHFGLPSGSGIGSSVDSPSQPVVPEPATMALLPFVAGLCLWQTARNRKVPPTHRPARNVRF